MEKTLSIFTDGGASGNPGPAAIGFVVKDDQGKVLIEMGKYIGKATNNVAEYSAVIEALKWIRDNLQFTLSTGRQAVYNLQFFLDSKLVVNQLNGLFKIKNSNLRNLIIEVRTLEKEIGGNNFYHFIPREKNRHADFLVHSSLSKIGP